MITNGFHVNALPHSRSECGAQLVRRFLANLSTEDDRCAAQVPPVRLVPRFARAAAELHPRRRCPATRPARRQLRVVSAVLLTCEDAIARARANGAGHGVGLRGGALTVTAAEPGYRLALHQVRWTQDVAVSESSRLAGPQRHGACHGRVAAPGGRTAGSSCSGPRASPAPARR